MNNEHQPTVAHSVFFAFLNRFLENEVLKPYGFYDML